jgi:hypothetical protein
MSKVLQFKKGYIFQSTSHNIIKIRGNFFHRGLFIKPNKIRSFRLYKKAVPEEVYLKVTPRGVQEIVSVADYRKMVG